MTLHLEEVVQDFATAFKAVDEAGPVGGSFRRKYRPGIGPLGENQAVERALE
jgi:hypothetical protein